MQAAKRGQETLHRVLSAGVVIVEQGTGKWGAGKVSQYIIEANTPISECLNAITQTSRGEHPLFGDLRSSTEYIRLLEGARAQSGKPKLHEIGSFLGIVGQRLEEELAPYERSLLLRGTRVEGLTTRQDGSVVVHTDHRGEFRELAGKCAVLAMGGARAPPLYCISAHADGKCREPVADVKVPKDASHRDLSDATLRFDLALGVGRRHAPKSRQK